MRLLLALGDISRLWAGVLVLMVGRRPLSARWLCRVRLLAPLLYATAGFAV